MEFCHCWGIAEIVRNAVWSSRHPLDFVYASNLTSKEVNPSRKFKVVLKSGD